MENTLNGLVMRSTGSWYDVRASDGHIWQCRLKGKFKIQGLKTSNPIAVGDRVQMEIENEKENFGIITHIEERENYIIRQSVHKTAQGHILAANLDQAVLIVTLSLPKTSLGFIDRFLVTAESFRIPVTIVFNKMDLLSAEDIEYVAYLQDLYENLGYGVLATSVSQNAGIEAFAALLRRKVSLLAGHSGVGKSSLVNAIAPHLDLRTTEVSTFANKGVHTTTFATMFELPNETFLIDSPGIKELGLIHTERWEIAHYFPEMREKLNECRFDNCLHLNEPACAIHEAVRNEEIAESRYRSYLSMIEGGDNRK